MRSAALRWPWPSLRSVARLCLRAHIFGRMTSPVNEPVAAIALRDLRLVYPNGLEALRRVSLTVADGEIVVLLGRSGAGKSTLLRAINGLQPVTSGEVWVGGVELGTLPRQALADVRRTIGFIWQ